MTDTLILIIWEKAMKDCKATTKDIEFKKFYDFLLEYFHLEKKPEESHYLKEALRLPTLKKLNEPDPNYISYDDFAILGRLFKLTKKEDESFIKRIVEVFKADWFYGCVDRTEAQRQLDALQKKVIARSLLLGLPTTSYCVLLTRKIQMEILKHVGKIVTLKVLTP